MAILSSPLIPSPERGLVISNISARVVSALALNPFYVCVDTVFDHNCDDARESNL